LQRETHSEDPNLRRLLAHVTLYEKLLGLECIEVPTRSENVDTVKIVETSSSILSKSGTKTPIPRPITIELYPTAAKTN
jgi:hypothetical protein